MNRMDEYTALLAELEQTPEALSDTVSKALDRKNALQKKRRILRTSLGGFAACFAAFVLLVNLSMPFARACGRIPVLSALAKAVSCFRAWKTIMYSPWSCHSFKTGLLPVSSI